ncbi:MAG: hypothetical protein M9918_25275, partial [Anaerolineae bacterium]|nr:hypothetical protein [Anaerolineae bacterium]
MRDGLTGRPAFPFSACATTLFFYCVTVVNSAESISGTLHMIQYIIRRTLLAIPVLLAILVVVFVLAR